VTELVVIDQVFVAPTSNLLGYESGYFNAADVGRFGMIMLGLAMLVGLGIAIPYWSLLRLPLTVR
jgi:hypothetical protein